MYCLVQWLEISPQCAACVWGQQCAKVLINPRIKVDEDYDHTKEGNEFQSKYMHKPIRRRQKEINRSRSL